MTPTFRSENHLFTKTSMERACSSLKISVCCVGFVPVAHYKVGHLEVGTYSLIMATWDMGPLAISRKSGSGEILFHLATENGGLEDDVSFQLGDFLRFRPLIFRGPTESLPGWK